jgi:hypothetical protein
MPLPTPNQIPMAAEAAVAVRIIQLVRSVQRLKGHTASALAPRPRIAAPTQPQKAPQNAGSGWQVAE